MTTSPETRMSGFEDGAKPLETFTLPHESGGQSYPPHYPPVPEPLGAPLTIREVAHLLGCSDWTVRHGHLPQGLPHFRSGPGGKLVFFRNQVIQWILQQQKKGGI